MQGPNVDYMNRWPPPFWNGLDSSTSGLVSWFDPVCAPFSSTGIFADCSKEVAIIASRIIVFSFLSALSFTTWYIYSRHKTRVLAMACLSLILMAVVGLMAGVGLCQTPTSTSTQSLAGAQFTVPASADIGQNIIPNIVDPLAVNPQSVCPGYRASNVVNTKNGLTADLTIAGSACNVYGNDIETLALKVEYQAEDRLHVSIMPKYIGRDNYTWFVIPDELIPAPGSEDGVTNCTDIEFTWSNNPTFSFNVTRKGTGDVLFSTEGSRLVYEDQFIEFGSGLPENYNLYGLGEVIHGLRLGNNLTRTLYAADVGDVIDANIYGSHPIYYDTRYFEVDSKTGTMTYAPNATDTLITYKSYTHGVFNRNVHGQEILLRESNITWRALGGSIDLYFYQGSSQDAVTKSYQKSAIGMPAFQQLWTFGFHQCRWGYRNWSELQDVVDNFKRFGIPLETIWTDIDYMNQYRDFDNDAARFSYGKGADFLSRLHANKQHYVPIVDSAIYVPNPDDVSDAYPVYDRGVEQKAFMLNPDGSLYIGEVWPGYTVFPDWIGALLNGTGANDWWTSEVSTWYDKVKFDGIWIDMSEVSSFCVGSCGSQNLSLNPVHPGFQLPGEPGNLVLTYPEGFNLTNATQASSASSASAAQATPAASSSTSTTYLRTTPTPGARNINWPPYVINNNAGDLGVHAVSPNATHHGGAVEYDFHNVFGHQILNATYHALLEVFPGKRPFIIGRSQLFGSSKWAGHWGGDNYSLWAFMYFAIPQALSLSLFGFPMFGPDTCGFSGNADMELCARWMQLSAFFTFYRNHNQLGADSQEPYVWTEVAEATRTAMKIRYSLLPYIYTTFYLSHSTGSTTMRALAWDFPDEPWLADADRQFLLGDAIMVTPCLQQGATTVDGVFPGVGSGTVWYDWYNLSAVTGVKTGQNVTIDAPLGHIPLYIKGGSVLPMHEPALTVEDVKNSPWGLIVALDNDAKANGGLYLDDGESLIPNATTWVQFSATEGSLTASPSGKYSDINPLENVTVLGVPGKVSRVQLDGQDVESTWILDQSSKMLQITGLNQLTKDGAWVKQRVLTWA